MEQSTSFIDNLSNFIINNSTYFVIIWILICCLSYILFKTFSCLDITKDLSNEEYEKYENDYDMPENFYPNGWIPILESRKLNKMQVETVKAFGQELIVFRGSNGEVNVLDAYCPHLGAHLGHGGSVLNHNNESCIKCPFHGWTFRGSDGLCVKIPHTDDDNDCPSVKARVRVWKSMEINGFIQVWYHDEESDPHWFPIEIPEVETSQWSYSGRTEHLVSCYFQEIPENGADIMHLKEIHKLSLILGGDMDFLKNCEFTSVLSKHQMSGQWSPCPPPHQHIANMKLKIENFFLGLLVLTLDLDVHQIGPAFVHLRFNSSLFNIKGSYLQFVTPISPKKQRIIHHVYLEPSILGKIFAKFLLYGEAKMLERDIYIWNRKRFLKNPLFTKNEKSLVKFRRWFNQFYSSKTIKW